MECIGGGGGGVGGGRCVSPLVAIVAAVRTGMATGSCLTSVLSISDIAIGLAFTIPGTSVGMPSGVSRFSACSCMAFLKCGEQSISSRIEIVAWFLRPTSTRMLLLLPGARPRGTPKTTGLFVTSSSHTFLVPRYCMNFALDVGFCVLGRRPGRPPKAFILNESNFDGPLHPP